MWNLSLKAFAVIFYFAQVFLSCFFLLAPVLLRAGPTVGERDVIHFASAGPTFVIHFVIHFASAGPTLRRRMTLWPLQLRTSKLFSSPVRFCCWTALLLLLHWGEVTLGIHKQKWPITLLGKTEWVNFETTKFLKWRTPIMTLHNCYVVQADYDASAVLVNLKKNWPTNMSQIIERSILSNIRKSSLKHHTLPRFESSYFVAGLLPYLYATDPWYLGATVLFVI